MDTRPYRYDNTSCANIQKGIADSINAALVQSMIPMVSYFAPNASNCAPLVVSVCGTFQSTFDAQRFTDTAQGLLPFWLEIASGGSVCRPELEGYKVTVTTEENECMPLVSTADCFLPFAPFPNCT